MTAPAWWRQVVAELEAFQEQNPENLPGAVVGAETLEQGPLAASVGEGWSDGTICNVGSMTKTFTATGVLLALEEAELLDMELPVCRLPGMEAYLDDPVKSRIRVRHLLQHTSGMPVLLEYGEAPAGRCNDPQGPPPACADPELDVGPTVPWVGSPGYTNECVFADGRCRPSRSVLLEHVSRHIMETYPLVHEPGEEYSYSSANYVVAGRIVEHLTGRSLNVYLKEKLFSPAGMRDSFFVPQPTGDPEVDAWLDEGVAPEQRERIAEVSLITRDGKWPVEVAPGPGGGWDRLRRGWRFVYPDGGMFSTAADLLAYLRLVRDGGAVGERRVLSEGVVRLLTTDHGFGHTMAFGYRSTATPYGQGPGTLDHLGNIMTYFWLDPRGDDPLLGVFLSQRLANAVVNNNMAAGMKVIFRVFVPALSRAAAERAVSLAV